MSALLVASFVTTAHSEAQSVGSTAPDFVYASTPYGWRHLDDLAGPSGIVLLIDPAPDDLLALERDKPLLEAAGIRPVAVLREKDGACWRRLTSMRLTYSLLSDPAGVIAGVFGVPAADSGAHWFLIDGRRAIRAAGQESVVSDDFAARLVITLSEGTAASSP